MAGSVGMWFALLLVLVAIPHPSGVRDSFDLAVFEEEESELANIHVIEVSLCSAHYCGRHLELGLVRNDTYHEEALEVVQVREGGAVYAHNSGLDDIRAIGRLQEGDIIVSVNGKTGKREEMSKQLDKKCDSVVISFMKRASVSLDKLSDQLKVARSEQKEALEGHKADDRYTITLDLGGNLGIEVFKTRHYAEYALHLNNVGIEFDAWAMVTDMKEEFREEFGVEENWKLQSIRPLREALVVQEDWMPISNGEDIRINFQDFKDKCVRKVELRFDTDVDRNFDYCCPINGDDVHGGAALVTPTGMEIETNGVFFKGRGPDRKSPESMQDRFQVFGEIRSFKYTGLLGLCVYKSRSSVDLAMRTGIDIDGRALYLREQSKNSEQFAINVTKKMIEELGLGLTVRSWNNLAVVVRGIKANSAIHEINKQMRKDKKPMGMQIWKGDHITKVDSIDGDAKRMMEWSRRPLSYRTGKNIGEKKKGDKTMVNIHFEHPNPFNPVRA